MELPAELQARIDETITQYPVSKRSAILPLLHLIQEHFGYIEDEAVALDCHEIRRQANQRFGVGDFLSNVSSTTGGKTSHPGLPHAFLCDDRRLPTPGDFLPARRDQPRLQRPRYPPVQKRGREIQHRIRRMPGQLRLWAGLYDQRRLFTKRWPTTKFHNCSRNIRNHGFDYSHSSSARKPDHLQKYRSS